MCAINSDGSCSINKPQESDYCPPNTGSCERYDTINTEYKDTGELVLGLKGLRAGRPYTQQSDTMLTCTRAAAAAAAASPGWVGVGRGLCCLCPAPRGGGALPGCPQAAAPLRTPPPPHPPLPRADQAYTDDNEEEMKRTNTLVFNTFIFMQARKTH